jgi:hypothetical protein
VRGLHANARGLQPNLEGLHANARSLQLNLEGLQPNVRGLHANARGLQPNLEGLHANARKGLVLLGSLRLPYCATLLLYYVRQHFPGQWHAIR